MKYIAEVKLTKKAKSVERIAVVLDKDIEDTFYDEIEDLVYERMDIDYPESECPDAFIYRVFVEDEDGTFPVVRESDKDDIKNLKKSKKYSKFLILPEAHYTLTPECELWMKMKEKGIIPNDSEFDYDKFHEFINSIEGIKKN